MLPLGFLPGSHHLWPMLGDEGLETERKIKPIEQQIAYAREPTFQVHRHLEAAQKFHVFIGALSLADHSGQRSKLRNARRFLRWRWNWFRSINLELLGLL